MSVPASLRRNLTRGGAFLARALGAVLAVVVLSVVVLAGVLFLAPAWLVNDRSVTWALPLAARFGVNVTWREAHVEASKPEFFTHRFRIALDGVCVAVPSVPFRFCADRLRGQADLAWDVAEFPAFPRVTKLGAWTMSGGVVTAGPFAPSQKESTFDMNRIPVPAMLRDAVLDPSTFAFDRVSVVTPAGTLEGRATLSARQAEDARFGTVLALALNDPTDYRSPLCWMDPTPKLGVIWEEPRPESRRGKCLRHVSLQAALGEEDGYLRVARVGPLRAEAVGLALVFGEPRVSQDLATPPDASDVNVPYRPGYRPPVRAMPPLLADARLGEADLAVADASVTVNGRPRAMRFTVDALAVRALPLTGESLGDWTEVRARATARDLCVETPYADGCVEDVALAARLGPPGDGHGWRILAAEEARADAKAMTFLVPASSSENSAPPPAPGETAAATSPTDAPADDWRAIAFEGRDPAKFHVTIDSFTVRRGGEAAPGKPLATGKAALRLGALADGRSQWRLEAFVNPHIPAKAPPPSAKQPKPEPSLAERLRTVDMRATVTTGPKPLQGPFAVSTAAKAGFATGEHAALAFEGENLAPGDMHGKVIAQGALRTGERFALVVTGRQASGQDLIIDGRIDAGGIKGFRKSTLAIAGQVSPRRARVTLDGGAFLAPGSLKVALPQVTAAPTCDEVPPPGPHVALREVSLRQCALDMDYAQGFPYAAATFSCPVHAAMDLVSPEAEAHGETRPLTIDLSADARVAGVRDAAMKGGMAWHGEGSVRLLRQDLFGDPESLTLATAVSGNFRASQADPAQGLEWKLGGGAEATIPSFARLVEKLRHYPYAIPAPFNVFDGLTKATVSLDGDSRRGDLRVPLSFTTVLRSPEQRFNVQADGVLALQGLGTPAMKPALTANVALRDIALTLPRVSLRNKFPMLLPDKRIDPGGCRAPAAAAAEESNFTYSVTVNTPPDNPVRISSNLADDVVPIVVKDLVVDNGGVRGGVDVRTFGFEIFRRKASVRHFDVTLRPMGQSPVLDGLIRFAYTDITIDILIHGTAAQPIVAFESDPIRSEREIISILLYGQEVDQIDEDQLQSADNLNAAMADRMIGLASLYLLASTPVESIRYNPATKAFAAKVRIDPTTSVTLGTTMDADQRVGVRRRLTRSWSVETNVEKNQTTGVTSGSAMLEWSKRF